MFVKRFHVWFHEPTSFHTAFHKTSAIFPVDSSLHKATKYFNLTFIFTNSHMQFYTLPPFLFEFLSSLLHRSESSSSYPGPFESDHDGDGLHLYRHVPQQRSALLSQARLLLFHPIRWELTVICCLLTFKYGNNSGWWDNVISFKPVFRCSGPALCPDIPPVCAGLAVQWPLCTFTPWAVLVRGVRGLSGSHSYSRRFPLHHPLPSFQPLAEMLAAQE